MSFTDYMRELRSRCVTHTSKIQFVVVFKKPKQKELKKVQQLQATFYLSQEHKIGFIGIPHQERELKKQGLTNIVTRVDILNPKNYKYSNVSTLLMNPSALSQLSLVEREKLSYWDKFPSIRRKEFVYDVKDIGTHRQKPFKFKWNTSYSISIPMGNTNESNDSLKKQFQDIVAQYTKLLSPKIYPVKQYYFVTTQGAKLSLPAKFIMEN
jgi:ribosomal protein L1